MMHYDLVFLTHLPAFYKINLYNEIAKKKNLLVIFVSDGSLIRNSDFTSAKMDFDYFFLNQGEFESRNIIKSCYRLLNKFNSISMDKLVVGGWDLPEFWLGVFIHKRTCNAVVVESSIYESKVYGIKKYLKKLFLFRVSSAYCSGTPHMQLINDFLNFHGVSYLTKGVGIMNFNNHHQHCELNDFKSLKRPSKFLYVGRLSDEKGLLFTIDFFMDNPKLTLTIVGDGPLKETIQRRIPNNVKLLGSIDNMKLGSIYASHDIFILPSHREPWGLVIEEALYFGLPVLCSSMVGCNIDLVKNHNAGVIFLDSNKESLKKSMDIIIDDYNVFVNNVATIDLVRKNIEQVGTYLS